MHPEENTKDDEEKKQEGFELDMSKDFFARRVLKQVGMGFLEQGPISTFGI